jgi:predicted phosphate transport protein (TIGR00153 family)
MARRQDSEYYALFIKMSDTAVRTQAKLVSILSDFDPKDLYEKLNELHQLESEGDKYTHELMAKVAHDFVTPIERDDIISLTHELDEIIDAIEDVLIRIYMFNIKEITDDAKEMLDAVGKCCSAVFDLVSGFSEFRSKSDKLRQSIIEINRLEELSDKLYIQAMHKLYVEYEDAKLIVGWTEVYRELEKCSDTCEHIADVIEGVFAKNS